MRMHRGLCLTLATSVLLAACGQPIRMASGPIMPLQAATAVAPAATLAADFAAGFAKDEAFQAIPHGAIVTVTGPEGIELTYDFSRTPQTGKVTIRSGNTTTETTLDGETPKVATWFIAKLAIRMIYGGVKAYVVYTHNHTGSDYDKNDLIKAVLYGVLSQGVAGLPGGFLWKRLLPIVWEWIAHEPPIHRTTAKAIYERWSRDLPKIEAILRDYQKQGGKLS